MSAATKMGIGTTSTVDVALSFIGENIRSERPHLSGDDKFRGTYSNNAGPTIEGPERVAGSTEHEFNPEEVAIILPLLGFTNTTGTFSVNDSALPERYMTVDREEKVFTYSGMQAARASIRCSAGMTWRWNIDWLGEQETIANAGTFPSLSNLNETTPLALHHATITLLGSARVVDDVSITIDNVVEHRSFNADYHTPERHGRIITVEFMLPYEGNTDLLRVPVAGDDGIINWTYGNYSSVWTFGNLQFPRGAVEKTKGSKRMLSISGVARQTGATKELVIVHDSTP
jgi:hypothetical protein